MSERFKLPLIIFAGVVAVSAASILIKYALAEHIPPLVIAACGLPGAAWVRRDGKNYADVDATIAMDHLILSATSEGLGTCWVAAFNAAVAREIFALPPEVEPIAFTPLGFAADAPQPRQRRPLEELVRYERW